MIGEVKMADNHIESLSAEGGGDLSIGTVLWFILSGMLVVSAVTTMAGHLVPTSILMTTTMLMALGAIGAFVCGSMSCDAGEAYGGIDELQQAERSLKMALWLVLSGMFVAATILAVVLQQFAVFSLMPVIALCAITALVSLACGLRMSDSESDNNSALHVTRLIQSGQAV